MVHVVVRVWRLENSFGESILGSGAQTQVVGRAYQIVLLAEPANPDQEIFINPQLYCGKKVEYLVWWHPCTASMWEAEARDYPAFEEYLGYIYPVTETQAPLSVISHSLQ